MNASNAVQDASIGSKASTNTTDALAATNAAQDIAISLRATISQLAATSAADRAYADALTDPNALTNGVGSGCTVTSTGKTFYVYVVAPTGTAASVDVDLQNHKTNATAHSELFGVKLDSTATGAVWSAIEGKQPTGTYLTAETLWIAASNTVIYTNNPALTDNRTDGAAWHYGDSVTNAVDSVARSQTNYDAFGSALAVSNSFTNAASLAGTALQAEVDTLESVIGRNPVVSSAAIWPINNFAIWSTNKILFLGGYTSIRKDKAQIIINNGPHQTGINSNQIIIASGVNENNAIEFRNGYSNTVLVISNNSIYGSGSNLTGITADQVGALSTNTADVTAAIVAAGAVTNSLSDPYMTPTNLLGLISGTTATWTRAWGNAGYLTPTGTVYFAADATMTDTNGLVGFSLDLFYNGQTFGFVGASVTNTATLVSNSWNSIIFWKGRGSSVFVGK
jgi:hypothetical protein